VLLFEATEVATETRGVYTYDLAAEELTLLKGDAWNPIPSSDGTQIAVESVTEDGSTIWIYNFADDTWTILDFEAASAPTWSPDGATLAFAVRADEGSSIVLFDGEGAQTVAESSDNLSMTSFSPGGEALAFATTPSEGGNVALNVVSLDGAFAATVTPDDTNLVEFVWAPPSARAGDEASSVPNTNTTSSMTWLPVADLPSNRA
jgi:Tol biopolymer transport system component